MRAHVKRPRMLALAVGLAACATIVLGAGLVQLSLRQAAAPQVVAVEKRALAEALEEAPWTSSGGEGPAVWVVTAPGCQRCRAFERQVLDDLVGQGVDARVIVAAPRAAKTAQAEARHVAALSRRRDWAALDAWMHGRGDKTGVVLEPAAVEGYLEWGRASYERIDRALRSNGMTLAAPALFWRDGPEWRACIARACDTDRAQRDIARLSVPALTE